MQGRHGEDNVSYDNEAKSDNNTVEIADTRNGVPAGCLVPGIDHGDKIKNGR